MNNNDELIESFTLNFAEIFVNSIHEGSLLLLNILQDSFIQIFSKILSYLF